MNPRHPGISPDIRQAQRLIDAKREQLRKQTESSTLPGPSREAIARAIHTAPRPVPAKRTA